MNGLLHRIYRNKPLFVTLCLILFLLLLTVMGVLSSNKTDPFSNAVNTILTPVRVGLTYVEDKVYTFTEALSGNKALKEENESLRAEIAELEQTIRDNEKFAEENDSLKAMLEVYGTESEYDFCLGKVIGRSFLTWNRTVTLDCGSMDGVSVYDAVVTAEGMVGYVSSVSISSCTVVCITDPSMSCSAILSQSHETGIAEGNYEQMKDGSLLMSLLPTDASVSVGEVASTSGLGGVFPGGLVIGTVKSVFTEENGLSQTAVLSPSVDIMQVKTVYVITDFRTHSQE